MQIYANVYENASAQNHTDINE